MANKRVVAVGLLTQQDLARLGPDFTRIFPLDETPCFGELLRAIDEADRVLRRRSGNAIAQDHSVGKPSADEGRLTPSTRAGS